jgi:hypothetical protein
MYIHTCEKAAENGAFAPLFTAQIYPFARFQFSMGYEILSNNVEYYIMFVCTESLKFRRILLTPAAARTVQNLEYSRRFLPWPPPDPSKKTEFDKIYS